MKAPRQEKRQRPFFAQVNFNADAREPFRVGPCQAVSEQRPHIQIGQLFVGHQGPDHQWVLPSAIERQETHHAVGRGFRHEDVEAFFGVEQSFDRIGMGQSQPGRPVAGGKPLEQLRCVAGLIGADR